MRRRQADTVAAQTICRFQELNYWGKTDDNMHAYSVSDKIYIDPNTTPLWSPTIPVKTCVYAADAQSRSVSMPHLWP